MEIIVFGAVAGLALLIVWWALRTVLVLFIPAGPIIAFERAFLRLSNVVIALCVLGLVGIVAFMVYLAVKGG